MTTSDIFQNFQHVTLPFKGQTNSFDCGLYVCVLIRVLSNMRESYAPRQKKNLLENVHMTKQREIILSEIFCGKLFP